MRQIFCKLPNPFPYLNYITKFFFGRKSYRQRVFQGPLTLGLQSPSLRASSFRLACGNPSIPARSFITAQTAHLLFCIFLSASVTTDLSIPRVLSQVFPTRVPARSHLTALNRAPVTFASFCPRLLQPTFPFRGCAGRFSCSGTHAQSYHRAKPRTCCFASFCPRRLQPTFALRGCARRFSCSGTRAQFYYRANRAPAVLHPSVRVGYNRRFHSAGALAGFPARIPARNHITAQTAHLLFLHPSVRVGYNRRVLPAYNSGENPLYFSYEKNLYRKP